jgi:hypothetical protein
MIEYKPATKNCLPFPLASSRMGNFDGTSVVQICLGLFPFWHSGSLAANQNGYQFLLPRTRLWSMRETG